MRWLNRTTACQANVCIAHHEGPVLDVLPAPLLSGTALSIGGKNWAIWKPIDLVDNLFVCLFSYEPTRSIRWLLHNVEESEETFLKRA